MDYPYFILDWFSDDWSLRFCALTSVGAFFLFYFLEVFMFDNIGEKIKWLAIISTILGCVFSLVGAICCWASEMGLVGFMILIGGCFFSWIGSFLLYGFGELIVRTTNIAIGNQRMQMLAVYNNENESSDITKQTIDDIKDEIVKDYEYDKKGYMDELDEMNIPNQDECPCCFNKINVEDNECSYCGYKLK